MIDNDLEQAILKALLYRDHTVTRAQVVVGWMGVGNNALHEVVTDIAKAVRKCLSGEKLWTVSVRRETHSGKPTWCVYRHDNYDRRLYDAQTCPDSIRTQAEAVAFASKLWRVREQDVKVEEEVRDVSYCLPKGVKVGI